MEYGFSNYGSKNIINKNEFSEYMIIDNSYDKKINYYLSDDVNIIVNKNVKDVKYEIEKELYNIKAPLKKNSKVGVLTLKYDNNEYKYDLIVKNDIKKITFFKVFSNLVSDLISGVELN